MATLTLTATRICSGGNHVTIRVDVNAVEQATQTFLIDELVDAVQAVDVEAAIVTLIRLHKIGRTNAQVRNDLLAGLDIIV